MPTLIIVRGISGSGKSTWARTHQAIHGPVDGCVVVSRDDLRYALFGSYFGSAVDENLITIVELETISIALKAGKNVISDNTNLYPDGFIERANVAKMAGADVELYQVETPLHLALENNAQRVRKVPERVISRQSQAFEKYREAVEALVDQYTYL